MQAIIHQPGYRVIHQWLSQKGFQPFPFQEETWQHIVAGNSGLVNAPTGMGKTYSVFLGALIRFINQYPNNYQQKDKNGLQLIWVTPLRALAKDIGRAMEEVITELGMQWKVGIRNGDTSTADRQKQKRQVPEVLIITPESLQLMLASKGYAETFKTLRILAVDEWHELIGSKRGVQVELAISRIKGLSRNPSPTLPEGKERPPQNPPKKWLSNTQPSLVADPTMFLKSSMSEPGAAGGPSLRKGSGMGPGALSIWGISATIGNLEQAAEVLLRPLGDVPMALVRAQTHKPLEILSILPDEIERYPWAGHLGIKLAEKVLPIIHNSRTTIIFINTRAMSEIWYQTLLNIAPDLAGAIALHHGSIETELRNWVEDALHEGRLKAVVATASLDLGVDFRPVETVIQVGSPKGVARFLQRAGRSGHSPGAVSRIYFLPTHSLELVEAASLKAAAEANLIESREPLVLCYDVLVQYLCTLAVSDGFIPDMIYEEVKATYCYSELTRDEFDELLHFITSGGNALHQYDEYHKVVVEEGVYKITSRRIAMRHRMHIGTIVSDALLRVKLMTGGFIGTIEEYFISKLEPGDVFTLAGRQLELVTIKDMTVMVRKSNAKKGIVASFMGGRIPLSAMLGDKLRQKLDEAAEQVSEGVVPEDPELQALFPLFELQHRLSAVPRSNELLIEQIETKDGFHLFVYPFEGRFIHEALAALLAYRISRTTPITFSIAMNDYGFELLSDQPIPVDDTNVYELFAAGNLMTDIQHSVNATEMAKRKFRDIAVIGGLIFQGMPGEKKKARHLQASAGLLFNVFNEYDPANVLLRQAYQEVFDQQMEEVRLRNTLERIGRSRIILTFPPRLTPLCFPIKVDSMRENVSSEKLEDRVRRMQKQLENPLSP